jgi:hypothetical protein
MRRSAQISLVLVAVLSCLVSGDALWARNGHGAVKDGDANASKKVDELGGKRTGPQNAADRQVRNAVRDLNKLMDAVNRMRARAERTGNDRLRHLADRIEREALHDFHKRMEKIHEFRQRHGLPEIKHHLAP